MAKIDTLFMINTAEKRYPLGNTPARIYTPAAKRRARPFHMADPRPPRLDNFNPTRYLFSPGVEWCEP